MTKKDNPIQSVLRMKVLSPDYQGINTVPAVEEEKEDLELEAKRRKVAQMQKNEDLFNTVFVIVAVIVLILIWISMRG